MLTSLVRLTASPFPSLLGSVGRDPSDAERQTMRRDPLRGAMEHSLSLAPRIPFKMKLMPQSRRQLPWNHTDAVLLDLKPPVFTLMQKKWGARMVPNHAVINRTKGQQTRNSLGEGGLMPPNPSCIMARLCAATSKRPLVRDLIEILWR
jgi:hypothetical protein